MSNPRPDVCVSFVEKTSSRGDEGATAPERAGRNRTRRNDWSAHRVANIFWARRPYPTFNRTRRIAQAYASAKSGTRNVGALRRCGPQGPSVSRRISIGLLRTSGRCYMLAIVDTPSYEATKTRTHVARKSGWVELLSMTRVYVRRRQSSESALRINVLYDTCVIQSPCCYQYSRGSVPGLHLWLPSALLSVVTCLSSVILTSPTLGREMNEYPSTLCVCAIPWET